MTRSPNGASRSPAIHNALGSRSSPITRKPGNSVRKRSECPPAPSVASTRTAPVAVGVLAGERRSQQLDAAVEQDGNVSVIAGAGDLDIATSVMRAPAPRSLSENPDLALGKYARVGSDRGHDARATCRSAAESDDVVQSFIGGRGEVLFVGLLVRLPCLRVPDLQVVNRSDHHAVLGKTWRSGGGRLTR